MQSTGESRDGDITGLKAPRTGTGREGTCRERHGQDGNGQGGDGETTDGSDDYGGSDEVMARMSCMVVIVGGEFRAVRFRVALSS